METIADDERGPSGTRPMLKKSRAGCRDCRLRKVKCDEVRPVCSNCRRRYVGVRCCEWNSATQRDEQKKPGRTISRKACVRDLASSGVVTTTTAPIFRRLEARPICVSETGHRRSLELRLMHHYTSVVCNDMPDCEAEPTLEMWKTRIPQLAFESEVVLNPMLALSALHLHAHSPHNSAMNHTLRHYLDSGLRHHRQALSTSTQELSEALWLSAVILANVNWLLARQLVAGESYGPPVGMWKMLHGVGMLFARHKDYLDRIGYGWYGRKFETWITPIEDLAPQAQNQFRSIDSDLLHLLDAFNISDLPKDEAETYVEAKDDILYQYRAFYSGVTTRTLRWAIGTMTIRCGVKFCDKLKQYDVLAMALLARNLALICGLEHAWWMNGVGDYKVLERDIPGMRALMPGHLQWTMDWPCRVLDGDIVLRRPEM